MNTTTTTSAAFTGWLRLGGWRSWLPVVSANDYDACYRKLCAHPVPPGAKAVEREVRPAGERPGKRRRP